MCVKCGAPKGEGNRFCYNCGHPVDPNAVVCTNCGCSTSAIPSPNAKSKVAAGLLGIFLGAFGVHNFYLGYNARGTVQLLVTVLTCGVGAVPMGIWALVEGIMLLCNSTNYDARGIPVKD